LWQRIPFGAKLIGSFLVIVLLAVGVSSWFTRDAIIQVFEEVAARDNARVAYGLGSFFEEYYAYEGSWEGLNPQLLMPISHRIGRSFLLANPGGKVLFSVAPELQGTTLPPEELAKGTPIMVNNQQVGVLLIEPFRGRQPPLEAGFMNAITRAILLAGLLTAFLATLLGIVLVRQVTAPLRTLARASEQIAGGQLNQRVDIKGEDELGQLGRSFNRMTANLERSEQARRQMLADVSHELRNPLMIVQGGLEAFTDGVMEPSAENLQALHAKTLLLNRLVSDLHELALAEAGELSLEHSPVDLADLLTQAATAVKPQLTEREIALTLQVAKDLPTLTGDAQRIEQVLLNLLSNAVRYTPAGGRITLRAQVRPHEVQIDVSDTGTGIPPEDLPHIFERFYRGDRSRARTSGGAGLGLAIAQALVAAHGGKIWVESQPGQGATFSFTLPY
jgi:signal transduction histidine kinase